MERWKKRKYNVDNETAQMVDDYLSDYEKQVNDELNSKHKE